MNAIAQKVLKETGLKTGAERTNGLEQKIMRLANQGTVFSEPIHEGEYTIITASRVHARPYRLVARPVGAIVISPKNVKFFRFYNPMFGVWALVIIAAIIFWSAMLLNPPWSPGSNLLAQVRELITTIRERQKAA